MQLVYTLLVDVCEQDGDVAPDALAQRRFPELSTPKYSRTKTPATPGTVLIAHYLLAALAEHSLVVDEFHFTPATLALHVG
jgi:hypothetical protein